MGLLQADKPLPGQALGGLLSQAAAAPGYHGDFVLYPQVHGRLLTIDGLFPKQAKAIIAAIGLRRTTVNVRGNVQGTRLDLDTSGSDSHGL